MNAPFRSERRAHSHERDVGNAGKLLGALIAGGGLGNLGDVIKPPVT